MPTWAACGPPRGCPGAARAARPSRGPCRVRPPAPSHLLGAERLDEPVVDVLRHHAGHVPAETCNLTDETRRQEGMLRARRQEEGVDPRQALVHLRQLQLLVEV